MLVAAVGWLLRKWLSIRITESLRLDTEQKLAAFRKRLDAAEAQVSAVRQAGIDANLQLSGAVVAERVAAIKKVWNAIVEWKSAIALVTIVWAIDREYISKYGGDDGNRRTFKTMLDSLKYIDLMRRMGEVQQCRPFVTDRAWALFAAYNGFFASGLLRGVALMFGEKKLALNLIDHKAELSIVRAVASADMAESFAGNPIKFVMPFIEFLEREILTELQKSLAGEQSGPEASRQAAKIVATVESVMAEARMAEKIASD